MVISEIGIKYLNADLQGKENPVFFIHFFFALRECAMLKCHAPDSILRGLGVIICAGLTASL